MRLYLALALAAVLLPALATAQTNEWVRDDMSDESLWLLRSNNLSTEAVGDQRWVVSKGDGPAYVVYFLPGRISEVEVDTHRATGSAGEFSIAVSTDGKLFQPVTVGAVQLDSAFGWDYRLMASDQIPANATHLLVRFPDGSTAHRLSEVWIKFAWDDVLASSFLPTPAQSLPGQGEFFGDSDEELEALLAALSQAASVGFAEPVSQSGYALPAGDVFKVTEPATPPTEASVEIPVLESAEGEISPKVDDGKEDEKTLAPESPIADGEEADTEQVEKLEGAAAEESERTGEETPVVPEEPTTPAENVEIPGDDSSAVGESAVIAIGMDPVAVAEPQLKTALESADTLVEVAMVGNSLAEKSAEPDPILRIEAPADLEQSEATTEPVEFVQATVEQDGVESEAPLESIKNETSEAESVPAPSEVVELQDAASLGESIGFEGSSSATTVEHPEESPVAITLNIVESATPETEPTEPAPMVEIDLSAVSADEQVAEMTDPEIPEGVMESGGVPRIEVASSELGSDETPSFVEVAPEMSGWVSEVSPEIELIAEVAAGTIDTIPPLEAAIEFVSPASTHALTADSPQIIAAELEAAGEVSREFLASGDVPTETTLFVAKSEQPESAGIAIREDAETPEGFTVDLEIEQRAELLIPADVNMEGTTVLEVAAAPAAIEATVEPEGSIQKVESIQISLPEDTVGIAQDSMAAVVEPAEVEPIMIAVVTIPPDLGDETPVAVAPEVARERFSPEVRLPDIPVEEMAAIAESGEEEKRAISLETRETSVAMHPGVEETLATEPPALSSEDGDVVAWPPIDVQPALLSQLPPMESQEGGQSDESLITIPVTASIDSAPSSEAIVAAPSSSHAPSVFTFALQSVEAEPASTEVTESANDSPTVNVPETPNQEAHDPMAGISIGTKIDHADSSAVVIASGGTADLAAAEIDAPRKFVPRRKRIGPRSK